MLYRIFANLGFLTYQGSFVSSKKVVNYLSETLENADRYSVLADNQIFSVFFIDIIFAYTENYFISKTIQSTIEEDEKLSQLGQESNENPSFGFLGPDNYFGLGYQPVSMDEIPNFLTSAWAVV